MRIRAHYEDYFRESLELDYLSRDRTLDQDTIQATMSFISMTMKQPASESRNGKASRPWPMQSAGKLKLNIGRK